MRLPTRPSPPVLRKKSRLFTACSGASALSKASTAMTTAQSVLNNWYEARGAQGEYVVGRQVASGKCK